MVSCTTCAQLREGGQVECVVVGDIEGVTRGEHWMSWKTSGERDGAGAGTAHAYVELVSSARGVWERLWHDGWCVLRLQEMSAHVGSVVSLHRIVAIVKVGGVCIVSSVESLLLEGGVGARGSVEGEGGCRVRCRVNRFRCIKRSVARRCARR